MWSFFGVVELGVLREINPGTSLLSFLIYATCVSQ